MAKVVTLIYGSQLKLISSTVPHKVLMTLVHFLRLFDLQSAEEALKKKGVTKIITHITDVTAEDLTHIGM